MGIASCVNRSVVSVEETAEASLSEIAEHVVAIPLETNERCRMGPVDAVKRAGSEFFMLSNRMLYRFDRTGRFLSRIASDRDGRCSAIRDFAVDTQRRQVMAILKSEVYQTYETGVKDLIWGQFISATLFLTDTKDEIGRQTLGPNIGDGWRYYNLTKTRRYGAELYAEQYLLDSLRLSQTFSYVKAKISSDANKGKEIPYMQKSKFILGIDYEPISKFKILTDIKFISA